MQVRFLEYNEFGQQETQRKGNDKSHYECCYIRGNDNRMTDMYRLFPKNKIIRNRKKKDIEQGITAAAGQVTEGLLIYEP